LDLTVTVHLNFLLPTFAVIVAFPLFTALIVAFAFLEPLFEVTFATALLLVDQVTFFLALVILSLKVFPAVIVLLVLLIFVFVAALAPIVLKINRIAKNIAVKDLHLFIKNNHLNCKFD
jgi:hypothetical protein